MKIERLFLQGFKSFADRTSLEFGPGIYGIVGPNGSGKSNLVEALRWVVGARARELRGEEAVALLFHGSDGRVPLGFAEVGLELGGNGRRVSLSRRLERDGSSEVRLNNARSTLRQVEQALMGTGLSRSGYAIVGQGEVGKILQAGPEVLLSYLEEAAGLRAVTQASKTAHERLESATLELQTRAQELAERKAAVAEKAAQAERARQAATLAARSLVLRRSVIAARIREADQEAKTAQQKAEALEGERLQVAQRLEALESDKNQAFEALEAAQSAYSQALRRAEALEGELRLVEQERLSLEGLLRRLAGDAQEGEARLARLRALPAPHLLRRQRLPPSCCRASSSVCKKCRRPSGAKKLGWLLPKKPLSAFCKPRPPTKRKTRPTNRGWLSKRPSRPSRPGSRRNSPHCGPRWVWPRPGKGSCGPA